MSVLAAAIEYAKRDWAPIPVPYKSKNPGRRGWQQLRITAQTAAEYFVTEPQNIGLLLGKPSNWLTDVDLDHPRCVDRADEFLPPTPAVFGRPSKPRSHRMYFSTAPLVTKKHMSKCYGMLVEARSTGSQTVAPPSTHESGEPIRWDVEGAEPARVSPDELLAAVERLANAVRVELGERASAKPPKEANKKAVAQADRRSPKAARIQAACVQAMRRMKMNDHNDGSGRLFAAACRVVEHNLSDTDGVTAIREFARIQPFPQDWSEDEIVARIRDAEGKVDRGVIRCDSTDGKPVILIDTDEHRVVTETIRALEADRSIYQRGGMLVRVLHENHPQDGITRSNGSSVITALPPACLRERMTKFATFTKRVRQGDSIIEVHTHPTAWLVNAADARGDWPNIRYLAGISDVPILRADGTLWQTPGYDSKTGVLYEPTITFPHVPEDVNFEDADFALTELMEVVCDFQFESDDHRAAWLAALLTPLARYAFDGPAPFFLVDANVPGAGKGLLMQTIGEIVLGREMPVSSYSHDSDEMRKKITSIALAGDTMVQLDNLVGTFGNDALDRALTTTRWKDRVLGKNELIDLPLLAVWYGTGNNVVLGKDMPRRVIHIRLDVLSEHPEERNDFKHPKLIQWIRSRRPQLLVHGLTILAAYCSAGRVDHDLAAFGSFEGWSGLVREAVVWVGMPDPWRTRVQLSQMADSTADALSQLFSAWQRLDRQDNGIVIAELLSSLYGKDVPPGDDASDAMRRALENLVGCAPGKTPHARQIGNKLRHFRRRVLGKLYLDSNPNEHNRNGAVWRLHYANAEADPRVCDSATLFSTPSREAEKFMGGRNTCS